MQTSIETTATVRANRELVLDEGIPARISDKVRVIVLIDDDLDERDWLNAGAANEVFELLADESEDLYSIEDGKPLTDEV
jgi:hypothetical protein